MPLTLTTHLSDDGEDVSIQTNVNVGDAGPPARPLSTDEMADVLDCSPNTVVARGERGELEYYRDPHTGHYRWRSPTMAESDWLRLTQRDSK